MDDKSKAQLKDKVLEHLLNTKSGSQHTYIYNNLLHPKLNANFLKSILEEIFDFDNSIIELEIGHTHYANSTSSTQAFLDKGGFTKIYEVEQQNKKDQELRSQEAEEAEKVSRKLDKKNLQLAERTIKYFWIPIGISVLGLLAAILISVLTASNNVNEDDYNTKIDSIENALEQLKTDSKEENEVLLERIKILGSLQMVQSKK